MMSTSCILIAGFFSRRISEATVRQDVRVRADAASKNTFRRDSVIEVEEGNDDRDDWVARDFCECCDEYYHSENVTWIERGFKKNGKGQKLYSACSRCFDKYVLD